MLDSLHSHVQELCSVAFQTNERKAAEIAISDVSTQTEQARLAMHGMISFPQRAGQLLQIGFLFNFLPPREAVQQCRPCTKWMHCPYILFLYHQLAKLYIYRKFHNRTSRECQVGCSKTSEALVSALHCCYSATFVLKSSAKFCNVLQRVRSSTQQHFHLREEGRVQLLWERRAVR